MCVSESADRTIDKDIVVVPQGMQHLFLVCWITSNGPVYGDANFVGLGTDGSR